MEIGEMWIYSKDLAIATELLKEQTEDTVKDKEAKFLNQLNTLQFLEPPIWKMEIMFSVRSKFFFSLHSRELKSVLCLVD